MKQLPQVSNSEEVVSILMPACVRVGLLVAFLLKTDIRRCPAAEVKSEN